MSAGPTPTVLVTGANSGIGDATVEALLDRGAHVVATVRSDEAEQFVARRHGLREIDVDRLDVTDADACASVIDRYRPDVLVNNAGSALLGAVEDVDDDAVRRQFETLVIAPIRLARLAAAHQRVGGGGRIVNISSVVADTAIPFTGWYGAAKAALDSVSDTLRLELAPTDISVISVECGAVDTDVWDGAAASVLAGSDGAAGPRRRWVELTNRAQPLFADPGRVGDVVAAASLDRHPQRVYRVGFGSRLGLVSNLLPASVTDAAGRVLFGLGRGCSLSRGASSSTSGSESSGSKAD